MENKIFKARVGAPFKKEDAQKIGEEIESIKITEGSLTPELVVKYAKKKTNFLNQYFEWDDTEASKKWRLQQARNIVNHIVEVVIIKNEENDVKAYYSVITEEGNNEYVSRYEAITIKSYREQLIDEMETTLENLIKMLRMFREQ